MTIREEYEYLKTELKLKLTDATNMCNLDFPFDFYISNEEEDRYFMRGLKTRLATKKAMIILDNTYKKVRLFPSEEIAVTFEEARDAILEDWKKEVLTAFLDEEWRYLNDTPETYIQYIETLIPKIKTATEPYIKILRTTTQESVEQEIKAKDKLKAIQEAQKLKGDDPKGLF